MKISNETKVGALTIIAVTFLILGYNFLRGRTVLKTGFFLYAKYSDTKKLMPSNPVFANGFQVGSVYTTEAADENLSGILVEIKMNGSYNLPENSVAVIETNPLGTPGINIKLGTGTKYLVSGDTIKTEEAGNLLAGLSGKIGPVADQLKETLSSLDAVLKNINATLDPNAKSNLQTVIANLAVATKSIITSTASLEKMLNTQSGALASSLNNMNSFSKNLADNNDKITASLTNMQNATEKLSKADIDGVVNNLKASVEKLNDVMAKVNSADGSLGAMLNSKDLYNNLNNTVNSLNTLIDDLRVHPKRYVNISVFGKKDKGDYLTSPLQTDSASAKKP